MRTITLSTIIKSLILGAAIALPASRALACGPTQEQIDQWVRQSTSTDETISATGISAFRSMGQFGLNLMCQAYDKLAAGQAIDGVPGSTENLQRLSRAIDAVARQRDAVSSRLYWHTDMNQAIEQARNSGRPILSLRLLGNLDEDLSCANSRFFRTVLYANTDIATYLRDHYVLHWQSLRPVPRITIDFGDGRRLERTITGNSIHYVLDSNGELVDAIPGLYGPTTFLKTVQSDETIAIEAARLANPGARANFLHDQHMLAIADIDNAWARDLTQLGVRPASLPQAAAPANPAAVTMCKRQAEAPMLAVVTDVPTAHEELAAATNEEVWTRLAVLHADDAKLDAGSIALMRAKLANAPAIQAAKLAPSKAAGENPFFRVMRQFQNSLAIDSVRNEYVIHRQIRQWIADGAAGQGLDALNQRVYAELFLTPLSDPWMGMAPPDVYAALDRGGLTDCGPSMGTMVSSGPISPRHP